MENKQASPALGGLKVVELGQLIAGKLIDAGAKQLLEAASEASR